MTSWTESISLRPFVLLALLAFALLAPAQDLPDPGRRLSREEQQADPEKPAAPQKAPAAARRAIPSREAEACKNARIYYQISCGAPGSLREYGRSCAEAFALYRESCEH
jgi:hypothetical protein